MVAWMTKCNRARVIEDGTSTRRQTGDPTPSRVIFSW